MTRNEPNSTTPEEAFPPSIRGLARGNPLLCHGLGLCSALAVTGRLETTLVLGGAILSVATLSCLLVSLLRRAIPHRVRLIAEMTVIASLVILVRMLLQAYWFEMEGDLGPYLALVVTNCLILARCESFALRNGPVRSAVAGLGGSLGYVLALIAVAVIREPLGSGTLLGRAVLPAGWPPSRLLAAAPGGFLAVGAIIWIIRAVRPGATCTEGPAAEGI